MRVNRMQRTVLVLSEERASTNSAIISVAAWPMVAGNHRRFRSQDLDEAVGIAGALRLSVGEEWESSHAILNACRCQLGLLLADRCDLRLAICAARYIGVVDIWHGVARDALDGHVRLCRRGVC